MICRPGMEAPPPTPYRENWSRLLCEGGFVQDSIVRNNDVQSIMCREGISVTASGGTPKGSKMATETEAPSRGSLESTES